MGKEIRPLLKFIWNYILLLFGCCLLFGGSFFGGLLRGSFFGGGLGGLLGGLSLLGLSSLLGRLGLLGLGSLLGGLSLLGFLCLGLLGLLSLGLLGFLGQLVGSLNLKDSLCLDSLFQSLADEGGNFNDVNLVVGSDVLLDGGQR